MLRNYLKIALRNLLKSKVFSAINIFGLAISMTVCLVIFQYVDYEKSYDNIHVNADRVFRVPMVKHEPNEAPQTFAFTYPAVGPHLKRDFPEVEDMIRIRRSGGIMSYEDVQHVERQLFFVDSSFFKLFSFPVIKGDPHEALSKPYKGMISESTAKKYFGEEEPIGKMLEIRNSSLEVAGVFADVPANSHMQFDILVSYITYRQLVESSGGDAENNWGWSDFYTYVLLGPNANVAAFQAKLPAFVERYKGEDMAENNYELELLLQPLRDIHLHSDLAYELEANGNARYVSILILIGIFILLIAWVNYINLSTARSIDRAREVGVRKVVGAQKGQLIRQFLLESALVNLVAMGFALFLTEMLMPSFSQLTGKTITFSLIHQPSFWLAMLALFVFGTLMAGLYPAFVLSSHKPISVLKSGMASSSASGGWLRKGLVVLQFTASVALIAGTFAVYRQLQYMRHQDLGVNIDQTLVLNDFGFTDTTMIERIQSFKTELERYPDIVSVSSSGDVPGKEVGNSWNLRWKNSPSKALKRSRTFAVDEKFFDQYGMELITGRQFSGDFGTDNNNLILNETALKVFGFESPEAALNEEITNSSESFTGRVVGVVKDYHQESLKFNFKPIIFYFSRTNWNYYSLKLNTDDLQGTIAKTEKEWKSRFPDVPFSYFFLDEFFNNQYQADLRFGYIFGFFTLLAIIVACLGLFGLSSFSVVRRTKEIGIRKVLGANIGQILQLLSKDYLIMVLVSSAIALPIAYYAMQKWLVNYAYSVDLGWWFFLVPLVLIVVITAITVSFQSIKVALANPVKALRYE